eukprot:NODE_6206_length_646_cov_2.932998_g5277_i0.p4 GENE.NODE_6206_length_646_cov_2.932998_g5277_i0~~NODE_6206_length_646_cov_2.932998_g5277_i0.p4  ORF type:complete len:52 (-),score=6.92 NODE_6206_length_646_cov_2.932998_g5277_i0:286-441(-)
MSSALVADDYRKFACKLAVGIAFKAIRALKKIVALFKVRRNHPAAFRAAGS